MLPNNRSTYSRFTSLSPALNRTLKANAYGFTLIEVLVAMAIFASLSIAAYQVVNQIERSNELSQQRSHRLAELQRTFVIMDGDIRQMALRQTRTNGEQASELLLQWQDYLLDSDEKGLMFSRVGWQNPQQQFPRGEVTKVGYRIKNQVLERVWWHYPDTPTGGQGIITPLLTDVESMDIRFYSDKKWLPEWGTQNSLPQALSVKLTLKDYGEIERIFLTPSGKLHINTATINNSGINGSRTDDLMTEGTDATLKNDDQNMSGDK